MPCYKVIHPFAIFIETMSNNKTLFPQKKKKKKKKLFTTIEVVSPATASKVALSDTVVFFIAGWRKCF